MLFSGSFNESKDFTIKRNSLRPRGKNFAVKKSTVKKSLAAAVTSKIKSSYQFRREEVCNLFKEKLFERAYQKMRILSITEQDLIF